MTKKQIVTWLAGWPLWPFSVGAIASGPFLLRDVSSFTTDYPRWAGPIELVPWAVGLIFVVSLIGLIGVQWGRSQTRESYRELQVRADRAQELEDTVAENIGEIVNGIIAGFGNQLKWAPDENSRISLYVDNGSDGLVSIGRVATSPNHRGVGRKVLPKDQGCVGQAWAEAWVFEGEFGVEDYAASDSHYGMPNDVINGLAMQPQCLAALRVDDGPESLAVLVFESLQPNRFNEPKIKREMSSFSGYLTGTLKTLTPHIPRPLAEDGEEL